MSKLATKLASWTCAAFWLAAMSTGAAGAAGAAWAAGPQAGDKNPEPTKQKAAVMETVNVTAKRYEAQYLDTGSLTTVLSGPEIERMGGGNAFEVLQRTGGVNFSAQFPGGITQGGMNGEIGIRGIRGGEQIMLNGIPIIEPTSGSYDIDQIPAAFLERVELVKGSNSTLYGSRAMTGVVNIRTKGPGKPSLGGGLTGGSHSYWDGNAWYRNEVLFLGANYTTFGDLDNIKRNYRKRTPYNTSLFSPEKYAALASFQPWQPITFNYMVNYTKASYRADYYTRASYSHQVDEKVLHHYLSATYAKDKLKATAFFNYNYMNLKYDYYGNAKKPGKENDKKSFVTGLDAQHSTVAWDTLFLYGGTYTLEYQDETRQDVKGSSRRGYYIQATDLNHTRHQPSLFVQAEKTFGEAFILTLGIRGQGVINTEAGADNYFEPVPQVQAVWRVNANHSLYANVGRAFRVPTFNQLYAETALFKGNPELKPEYGWTYEVGWKAACGRFTGTLAAFLMDYQDKIRYVMDETQDIYLARNMDKYRTTGVEWNLAFQLTDQLSLVFGGYGADPWEEKDGVREQAGPKWQLAPGVYFDNGKLQLGFNASMMLDRERNLDDYLNLHLTGSYQFTDWLKLLVKVDNLLDQKLVVYGNMTPGYRSPYEVLDPGLWVYAGVQVDFSLL